MHVNRDPSRRSLERQQLLEAVTGIFETHQGRYGHRISRRRVAGLMQQAGLKAHQPRRFRPTTDSQHPHLPQSTPTGVSSDSAQPWSETSPMSIPLRVGCTWLWSSTYTVVGWHMEPSMTADFQALAMAIPRRYSPTGLIYHTDRGS